MGKELHERDDEKNDTGMTTNRSRSGSGKASRCDPTVTNNFRNLSNENVID